MAYSINDAGRAQKRQAIATFDSLARQEQYREQTQDQLDAAQDQQQAQTVGNIAGMGASYGIDKWLTSSAPAAPVYEAGTTGALAAEGAAPIVESAIATEAAAGAAGATAAGTTAGTAAGATAAGSAAGAGAATGAAAGGAGAAAGSTTAAAGTAAGFGPVGWVVAGGLLAYSLFG